MPPDMKKVFVLNTQNIKSPFIYICNKSIPYIIKTDVYTSLRRFQVPKENPNGFSFGTEEVETRRVSDGCGRRGVRSTSNAPPSSHAHSALCTHTANPFTARCC